LIAYQQAGEEGSNTDIASKVSKVIGADYVAYNDTLNLSNAIGISSEDLCFSCSTGDYSPLGIKPIFKSRAQTKGED
jgi:amidophosphoribosyltransferase